MNRHENTSKSLPTLRRRYRRYIKTHVGPKWDVEYIGLGKSGFVYKVENIRNKANNSEVIPDSLSMSTDTSKSASQWQSCVNTGCSEPIKKSRKARRARYRSRAQKSEQIGKSDSMVYAFKFYTKPEKCLHEKEILKMLDHPFIIKDLAAGVRNVAKPRKTLLMEYLPIGSLSRIKRILIGRDIEILQIDMWTIFEQIVEAVTFLHEKGVVHGDLKFTNVLLDDEGRIKIIDFGSSFMNIKVGFSRKYTLHAEKCGHLPPELKCKEKRISPAVDWYALGASTVNFITEEWLQDDEEANELIFSEITSVLPAAFSSLLKHMTAWDIEKRLGTHRDGFEFFSDYRFRRLHAIRCNNSWECSETNSMRQCIKLGSFSDINNLKNIMENEIII